jgi:hypothetical protein
MHVNHTKRRSLGAGTAVLALTLSMPALAGDMPGSRSGGPGTLGTEVPFDSREAELYYQYYLPTDTPEALRIQDGMQRLRAVHEGVIALTNAGALSTDERVRAYARTLREDHARVDWALRRYFEYSRFDASGPAYAETQQAWRSAADEVRAAEGTALDEAFLSRAADLLEEAAAGVDELVPQARKARRQVLTSHLERERKLMQRQIAEARAIGAGGTVDAG